MVNTVWNILTMQHCSAIRKNKLLIQLPESSLGRIQGVPSGCMALARERERERHVRPALIGPSLRGRERERDRERNSDQTGGAAESGNALFFTVAFIP